MRRKGIQAGPGKTNLDRLHGEVLRKRIEATQALFIDLVRHALASGVQLQHLPQAPLRHIASPVWRFPSCCEACICHLRRAPPSMSYSMSCCVHLPPAPRNCLHGAALATGNSLHGALRALASMPCGVHLPSGMCLSDSVTVVWRALAAHNPNTSARQPHPRGYPRLQPHLRSYNHTPEAPQVPWRKQQGAVREK